MNDQYVIAIENKKILPEYEYEEIKKSLAANSICLEDLQITAKAYLFTSIQVFINSPLTLAFMTNLLSNLAYDSLKKAYMKIHKRVGQYDLVFRKGKCEIHVSIPQNASEKEAGDFFDEIRSILTKIEKPPSMREIYIVEKNLDIGEVEIKTILEYARERASKNASQKKLDELR